MPAVRGKEGMTIEEAIKHCEEVAHERRIESGECISVNDLENAEACYECGEEHKQLAEWLKELKQRREAEISTQPKTNGDKARESLSKLSDYKIAHLIDFCGLYDECDDCPMNGMKKCGGSTPTVKQLWLKQEVQKNE